MIRVDSDSTSPYKAGIEFIRNSVNGGRIYNDGGAVQVKLESDYGYESSNPTRGGFVFKTAPATSGTLVDAVRIDALGNLGIGAATPTARLDIRGGSSGDNDIDRYIRFKASNGEKRFDFYVGGTGNASRLSMFGDDGTTEGARISSSGDSYFLNGVGIGTASPQEKLHVYNAGTARIEVEGTTGPAAFKATNSQGSFGWYVPSNANNFRLWNFGTSADLVNVDASGNATFAGGVTVEGGTLDLGKADTASGHINAKELMTFNIDTDNDDTNRYFAWYKDSSSGSGTELLKILETGAATFAGNVTINGSSTLGDSTADSATIGLKHLLGYCENTDVDTGTETIKELALATYQAVFFDYVVKNGTNLRAGTVTAVHDGSNVEFTDTSTKDLGDTSGVTLSVDISGSNMRLRATTTSDNWIVKANIRGIKV